MAITQLDQNKDYENVVKRTKSIYKRMKSEHPFLTSSEDSNFAALFAVSDLSEEQSIEEMERCYRILKDDFGASNGCQSLSQVLALGEENTASKSRRTIELYDKLRENHCKYGKSYELPTLGVLALASENVEEMVKEVVEVDQYLSRCKGFGAFGIGKSQRIMYAAMLVAFDYTKKVKNLPLQTVAINSVTALIIAQEVATMAAVTASITAANASTCN